MAGTHSDITDKIVPLKRIGEEAAAARSEGRTVVLCHGTFDLLHAGHMRHFQSARDLGDMLIVTVTSDHHVMKGPGRPVFPDVLRAEMVASQGYVDWVGIVDERSAVSAIEAIKPDYYVKGADYRNPEDDISKKINIEREKVEEFGGSIHFTDEITFSASSILNRHFNLVDDSFRDIVEQYRDKGSLNYFMPLIEKVQDLKVLVLGETIIDEYVYVETLGKAAKESIIATQYRDREVFCGGVVAAANHVSSFCGQVDLLTTVGKDDPYSTVLKEKLDRKVGVDTIELTDVPTVRKQRYVDRSYLRKMFEVYYMDDTPLHGAVEEELLQKLDQKLEEVDLVVVTDFGHGMITPRVIRMLERRARFLAINAQTNSGNRGFNLSTKYRRADYLCIDEPEFRLACHEKHMPIEELMATRAHTLLDCHRIVITHGRQGCYVLSTSDPDKLKRIPALTGKVVDTIGAGDAFFAITSLFAAVGADDSDLGILGNVAGAMKVNIVGHRAYIERIKFLKYLETILK